MTNNTTQVSKNQIALLSFVDDLIAEKNDPEVTEENIFQVRMSLLKEVNEAIYAHLIGILPEEDLSELEKILGEDPSEDKLADFFSKKIPNLETEITIALLNFRSGYLS